MEIWTLVERLNSTVSSLSPSVGELVGGKLMPVGAIISAAMAESKAPVSNPIRDVYDGFHVEASSYGPGPSVGGSSNQH